METSRNIKAHAKIRSIFHRELYGYKAGIKDYGIILLGSLLLSGLLAFLFYNSVYGMVLFLPVFLCVYLFYFYQIQKKRLEKIKTEFHEILMTVANSLSAGSSVERSFGEAEDNLKTLYKNDCILQKNLHVMNQKVRMGTAIEKEFYAFSSRSKVEEIETFGELFLYAKRMGGDYIKNIRRLAVRMDERIATKEELESLLAEKMLELRIMSVVPIGIMLYLRLSAASFLVPLYQNVGGALVMTGCFLLYVGSVLLGVVIIRNTLEV